MSQSTLILSIDGKTDTDGDGIMDDDDLCIDVYGSLDSSGCPQIQIGDYGKTLSHMLGNEASTYQSDSDGDGIMDDADLCKTLAGDVLYDGCPSVSLLSGIGKNQCLKSQLDTHGLIIAVPVCTTCPCSNSASFQSLVRTCDILFPTILSPEKTDVFSR